MWLETPFKDSWSNKNNIRKKLFWVKKNIISSLQSNPKLSDYQKANLEERYETRDIIIENKTELQRIIQEQDLTTRSKLLKDAKSYSTIMLNKVIVHHILENCNKNTNVTDKEKSILTTLRYMLTTSNMNSSYEQEIQSIQNMKSIDDVLSWLEKNIKERKQWKLSDYVF